MERDWLRDNSPIVFAVDIYNPPMNYKDGNGVLQGMTIDYMNVIGDHLGITFQYFEGTWEEALSAAMNHEVDGVVNASFKKERLKALNFTESYLQTPDGILTLKQRDRFTGPASFEDTTIAIIRGSARKELIENYSPGVRVLEVENLESGLNAVILERADGFLDELAVIQFMEEEYAISEVKLNTLVFFPGQGTSHIALRNDETVLLEILNKAIRALEPDEIFRIRDKYQSRYQDQSILIDPGLTPEEKEWLKSHPILRVGADSNWAPQEYSDEGIPRGISIDYLKLLEPMLGVHFQIFQDRRNQLLRDVQNGELDMLSSIRKTPSKSRYLSFTRPYAQFPMSLLARSEISYIHNLSNLSSYRLGFLEGYAAKELYRIQYPLGDFVDYASLGEGIDGLLQGEVDILVDNQNVLNRYLSEKGISGVHLVGELPYSYDLSFGVREDWTMLVQILNKAIKAVDPFKEEEILMKWSFVSIQRVVDYKKLLRISLLFIILLLILLIWIIILIHNTRLRTEQLEEAKRMESIGNMAGGIAHDFKNILMGISGYAELLYQENFSREEKEQYFQEMMQAVENGTDLTNRILLYSRKTESVMESLNLTELINQLIPLMRQSSKSTLELRADLDQDIRITGDKTQLKQLLMNLATNGIQAMENQRNGVLTILLKKLPEDFSFLRKVSRQKESYVILSIEDNGKGIPKKIQKKIFDPYFTTRSREKGTGLGLATVERIVMNHRGDIRLESEPGKGTRFEIFLPREELS